MKRILAALAAAASIGVLALSSSATAAVTTVYDSIPNPQPSNVSSLGHQAYSLDEQGDHIAFSPSVTDRTLERVEVLMSSWACESGSWNLGTCTTTPGATFSHPITLNVYAVDASTTPPSPGALLASVSDTFTIPYRPSVDATNCPGAPATQWFDGTGCFNGLAHLITFDFASQGLVLPAEVIYGIAYNTTTHGANPIGAAACGANCAYDSLNVGISLLGTTVGTDVDPGSWYLDSTWNAMYGACGAAPLDVFRHACPYPGYTYTVRFVAVDDSDATPPVFSTRAKIGGGNVINENLPEYVPGTWATKNVVVYLRCTDPAPDVSGIDIFRGDKAVTFRDGTSYYSTGAQDECIDNAGNEAAPIVNWGPIMVDTKAPVCKPAPSTFYIKRSTTGSVTFNLNLSDATSGIETVSPSYTVSGGAQLLTTSGTNGETVEVKMGTSTAGRVDITWVVIDYAGNTTECKGVVRAN